MYTVTVLLSILILSAGYQCPLAQKYQATAFSGTIKLEPQSSTVAQNLQYKNTYSNALASSPQVGLGISGYRSGEIGQISISVDAQEIQKEYFIARVQSPSTNRWGLLQVNYLVTTKVGIQIGLVQAEDVTYDDYGFFLVNYRQKTAIKDSIKIRPYISGVSINIQPGGSLKLSYDSYRVNSRDNSLDFRFSSSTCYVRKLLLNVVIFDTQTPGVLFLDGFLQQNSLKSSTTIDIAKNHMEELRIYFVGLTDFSIKQSSAIWVNVAITSQFQLAVEAQDVDSIGISYLIIAFVQCGTCDGYPYLYDNICRRACPSGYQDQAGYCVPIQIQNCGSGYIRDPQTNSCVPACRNNQQWTGTFCSCQTGYNLINGQCQKCPVDTYFDYKTTQCISLCGPYADYKPSEDLCYCHTGYYVVNGRCGKCDDSTQVYNQQYFRCDPKPNQCGIGQQWTIFGCQCLPGYTSIPAKGICVNCYGDMIWNLQYNRCECPTTHQWSSQTQTCVPIVQNCGANQLWTGSQCACRQGYYRIGGICKQCPANSQFNPAYGFCQCITGYILQNGVCVVDVPQCQGSYERWYNGRCECLTGYSRDSQYGVCVPNCPANMHYNTVTRVCECDPGYVKRSDGQCYSQTCPAGQQWNSQTQSCQYICNASLGQYWDPVRQGCASCQPGYQWNYDRSQCIPITTYCNTGYIWDTSLNRCIPACTAQNQIWNGQKCVCKTGYYQISPSVCILISNQCNLNGQKNQILVNGICVCTELYERVNGYCICKSRTVDINGICLPVQNPTCGVNQIWNGQKCVCQAGYYEAATNYCLPSTNVCTNPNEILSNGVCICRSPYVRVNGVCQASPCPTGLTWNETLQKCQSACTPPKIWGNNACSCPQGYIENIYGQCVTTPILCSSANNEMQVNGQCVCVDGHIRNNNNQCVPRCPVNQQWTNGRCQIQCGEGELWSGVVCYCKDGYERTADNKCLLKCPFNEMRSATGSICVCIDGYTRNSQQDCVPTACQPGYRFDTFYQTCKPLCPAPHSYNPSTNTCICATGFEYFKGACVTVCGVAEIRNAIGNCQTTCNTQTQVLINGQCKCRVGLYLINGKCQECPLYSRKVNGVCLCTQTNTQPYGSNCPFPTCPTHSTWNPSTGSCRCQLPYSWIYGECRLHNSCLANSFWNGLECICSYGYVKVNGVCQNTNKHYYCPPNSFFNGVSCQCNSEYMATANGCTKCPYGRYWIGEGCGVPQTCTNGYIWHQDLLMCIWQGNACKTNEFWDGATCRCKQGYYWLSNQGCQLCPAGTIYDGKSCVNGLVDRSCNDPYQFWNGAACVCVPGFWMVDQYCVTCPTLMQWNGYYCQLRTGLTRGLANQSGTSNNSNTVPMTVR